MKRIVFIVEGDSEDEFVRRIIKPYLESKGIPEYFVRSIKITMSGGGHGFNNIEHFKNTVKPVLYSRDQTIVTTFIDHYRLNSERKLPGYDECAREADMERRLAGMEEKLQEVVQSIREYRFFVPYIQRHEFETLLFADPDQGFALEDDGIRQDVVELCRSFNSIEDINSTPEGAPSVRLKTIYERHGRRYNKGADAVDIAEFTTIEKMFEKCPRFKRWIDTLVSAML